MHRMLLILLMVGLGGCAHIGALTGKIVASKQLPNRLIATDGSQCLVSESRFEKVEIGRRVLCAWHGRTRP